MLKAMYQGGIEKNVLNKGSGTLFIPKCPNDTHHEKRSLGMTSTIKYYSTAFIDYIL